MKTQNGSRRPAGGGRKTGLNAALALGVLLGVLAGANAWAAPGHGHHHQHGGARFGVLVGAPLFWPAYGPYWYDPPYYRYNLMAPPPVYIERDAAPDAKPLWYFCGDPQGYYPYVKQCAGAWRPVAPESVIRER